MATIVAGGADRKASERKFYSRMALFLVLLVLLGFGPSFYLRDIVPSYPRPNPTLSPWVIVHGTVVTQFGLVEVAPPGSMLCTCSSASSACCSRS